MSPRAALVLVVLGLMLLGAGIVQAQTSATPVIYFYRDGQAVPVARTGALSGRPQTDAEMLLVELLAGPTPGEQTRDLSSALPAGTELITVAVSADQVTVDLGIPLDFLRNELDPVLSDAIVEQVVKTLHPLGLRHFHVRALDESGRLVPVSVFLPEPHLPGPSMPANDDPVPERLGPAPEPSGAEAGISGQPPAYGQGKPQGALTGTMAWLSAGHGWYWSETLNRWTTQRGNNNGLVEDLSNPEAVNYYLARYLWNAGADVWLVREQAMTSHEIIVDNDDGAPAYTETGSWLTSSSPGYEGGTYRWSSTFSTLTATATWTPNLPRSGWYPVWAWYRHGSNRPTDARYEIHHAGGVTSVSVSQEVHGMTWHYLGEYYFEAGLAGHVVLLDQSADPGQAVIADAMRFGGGLGTIEDGGITSGRPRWEEAAKYWARYQGAPPDAYANDVTSRPLYAEWETAKGYPGEAEGAVYISWHTNGGGGTGTNSYIHDTEPTTGSVELQDWVHAELISDLRAAWDPNWVNRGQLSADFGEVRELLTMPGILLEVAFHDNTSDAAALREPVFRQIAARAVYQGLVKYHAQRQGKPVRLLPEPPQRLVARNTAPGQITLSWVAPPCCDGLVGDAATAYKIYHSSDGRAFDNGIVTSSPNLALGGLPPGSLHFFRVTALNEGGESFPTPVVTVRTPDDDQPVSFLVVDGFDRLDEAAMIPQWESPYLGTAQRMFLERMNRYDYAAEHGQALSACGRAFDGAVNEAIEAGDVALDNYAAVDWFVGEDSVADGSLSSGERALLAAYLDHGGRLLISGAEIGYDLVGHGRDPAFYQNYLHASYAGDDAGTYQFAGVAGSIFEGISGRFDDSTGGAYDVAYPDRLAGAMGSTIVMNYVGGAAGGAAIAFDGPSRLVHLGFPLEAVTNLATRTALFCRAADFLVPAEEEPPVGIQRIVNPGFEQGLNQSAWLARASDANTLFYQRDSLPAYVAPHDGDWLAWLGSRTPGIGVTTILTQVVALPAGDPSATLRFSWFVHSEGTVESTGDHLSASIYDLSGALKTDLLTLTGQTPSGVWRSDEFDLGAFAGQTVQLVFRAVSVNTGFFIDSMSLTTAGPPGPDEFRALWVDAYHDGVKTRQQIDELIESAQAGNFNALVVQVRRRGDTYYPSTIDPWASDADPNFDALAYLIERAHAVGIEIHAWATTLAIWGGELPPIDPDHTFHQHGPSARDKGRDYWLMTSDTGGEEASGVYYLDPGHPDVVDYTVAVYAELATNYALDGVHLDRVRYAWQNWGYNPTSLARFHAQTGRDDLPAPNDAQWLQWRRDQVTALVRKIYLTVTAVKPRLRVSAALSVAGNPPSDSYPWETRTPYTHHLQDWPAWLEEGILDLGIPMTYRDEDQYPGQFSNWIAWEKDHQYGRGMVVGTGLYLNAVSDSMAQWHRVRQPSPLGNRALGLCGYSYGTSSDDGTPRRAFLNAAVSEVLTQTASTPILPWKDTAAAGHLMGKLVQASPCRDLDGHHVSLTGPVSRSLLTDGSGWFGTVDLPPGEYTLSVVLISPATTLQVPVLIVSGAVTQEEILLPACPTHTIYLPLISRPSGP
jgi:uncharacterized lipoprotein YddW (UPF0748 family)